MKIYSLSTILDFGKYQGKPLEWVICNDFKYLDYCINIREDFFISKEELAKAKELNKNFKITIKSSGNLTKKEEKLLSNIRENMFESSPLIRTTITNPFKKKTNPQLLGFIEGEIKSLSQIDQLKSNDWFDRESHISSKEKKPYFKKLQDYKIKTTTDYVIKNDLSSERGGNTASSRQLFKTKQKMYLFIDTETTGLPNNWRSSYKDVTNWPRLVQVGFFLSDEKNIFIEQSNYIIKPSGFEIPKEATDIHGISNDLALKEGEELKFVLNSIDRLVRKSDFVVGHNVSFDVNVLGAEFYRNKMQNPLVLKNTICTMRLTKNLCALGKAPNYKWPTLSELYAKLFNLLLIKPHNAIDDIQATAECFWELVNRNLINGVMSVKSKADWLMGFLDSLEHSESVSNKQIRLLREKLEQLLEEIGLDLVNEENEDRDVVIENDDIPPKEDDLPF